MKSLWKKIFSTLGLIREEKIIFNARVLTHEWTSPMPNSMPFIPDNSLTLMRGTYLMNGKEVYIPHTMTFPFEGNSLKGIENYEVQK